MNGEACNEGDKGEFSLHGGIFKGINFYLSLRRRLHLLMSVRTTIVFVLLLELGVVVLALVNYGWEIPGLQAIARYSGRLSLFIFSIIFLLHRQPGDVLKKILSEKFFLVFAIAHGVHLAELLSYV